MDVECPKCGEIFKIDFDSCGKMCINDISKTATKLNIPLFYSRIIKMGNIVFDEVQEWVMQQNIGTEFNANKIKVDLEKDSEWSNEYVNRSLELLICMGVIERTTYDKITEKVDDVEELIGRGHTYTIVNEIDTDKKCPYLEFVETKKGEKFYCALPENLYTNIPQKQVKNEV